MLILVCPFKICLLFPCQVYNIFIDPYAILVHATYYKDFNKVLILNYVTFWKGSSFTENILSIDIFVTCYSF